ncbi:MAG: hypothetical protein ACLP01_28700 [Solirubrobacteraceae bacterium]
MPLTFDELLGVPDSASREAKAAETYSADDDQTVTAAILLHRPARS